MCLLAQLVLLKSVLLLFIKVAYILCGENCEALCREKALYQILCGLDWIAMKNLGYKQSIFKIHVDCFTETTDQHFQKGYR